ncbi:prephenate dehydratase [Mucor velutinosus]|uniref:Prephenate dehydratase n=2 Tax=Mucor TaxID=4830 RepID=A0AAN7DNA9_9FUNG|nr:prephenate dehydratase [Mucor velutinosus]
MADYDRPASPKNDYDQRPIKSEEHQPMEDVRRERSRSPRSRSRSRSRSPKREGRSLSRSPVRRSSSRRHDSPKRRRSYSRSRSRSPRGDRRDRRRSLSPPPRRRSRSPRRRSPGRGRRNEANKEFHGTRDEPEMSNILGVFGLSLRTREVDLEEVFREFGTIEKVTIVYDHRSNRSRGFGFVYFKDQAEATRARDALNGIDIDDRKIRVDYSVTHRPHTPTPGEYMGERKPGYERDRGSYRHGGRDDRRGGRRRERSRSPRRRYYRSRSRSRSWSR